MSKEMGMGRYCYGCCSQGCYVLKGAMYDYYSSVLLVLSNPHVRDKKGIDTARDSDRHRYGCHSQTRWMKEEAPGLSR